MMRVEAVSRMPKPNEGWRHYKGTLYEIVGFGNHTETGEAMIAYRPWRDPGLGAPNNMWFRPLSIFLGMTDQEGKRRFEFEREADWS